MKKFEKARAPCNWKIIEPREKKLFDPSQSKRVTAIGSFSLGRFYKDHPLTGNEQTQKKWKRLTEIQNLSYFFSWNINFYSPYQPFLKGGPYKTSLNWTRNRRNSLRFALIKKFLFFMSYYFSILKGPRFIKLFIRANLREVRQFRVSV